MQAVSDFVGRVIWTVISCFIACGELGFVVRVSFGCGLNTLLLFGCCVCLFCLVWLFCDVV